MGKKSANSKAGHDDDAYVTGDNEAYREDGLSSAESNSDQEDIRIAEELTVDDTPCNSISAGARQRLETRKRLEAYQERQLLKESGWDDDDELFDDEYFSDVTSGRI